MYYSAEQGDFGRVFDKNGLEIAETENHSAPIWIETQSGRVGVYLKNKQGEIITDKHGNSKRGVAMFDSPLYFIRGEENKDAKTESKLITPETDNAG